MAEMKIVKVLIASPCDTTVERKMAKDVIDEWNTRPQRLLRLEAVLWESHAAPDSGDRVQGILNKQIVDKCDFAIGIFWKRIGTDTGVAPGGAVEEILRLIRMRKKVMLYFSNVLCRPNEIDIQQFTKLAKFKKSIKRQALAETYNEHHEFRQKLVRDLDRQVDEWFCSKNPLSTYHRILKAELNSIKMLGLCGVMRAPLNENTFVPLNFLRSQDSAGHCGATSNQKNSEAEQSLKPDILMKQAFENERRMLLITGDSGSGKTTLLKYYALCALDNPSQLGFENTVNVFYLNLQQLFFQENERPVSLPENLSLWFNEYHQRILETTVFENCLESGTSLVLLDGLDEIIDTEKRRTVSKWICEVSNAFSKAYFVVTSRKNVSLHDVEYELADIRPFIKDNQEQFLTNWFTEYFTKKNSYPEIKSPQSAAELTKLIIAYLENNKGLCRFAPEPMILQIIAILWMNNPLKGNESRVELYRATLDYLLDLVLEKNSRTIHPILKKFHACQVLAPISLWMQDTKKEKVRKVDLLIKMTEELSKLTSPPDASFFRDDLVDRAGLLVESNNDDGKHYHFLHKSFCEYLAGFPAIPDLEMQNNILSINPSYQFYRI